MNKKNRVKLTEAERTRALEVKHDKRASKTIRNRSEILMLADESVGMPHTHEDIAKRVDVKLRTVTNVVRDFCEIGLEETIKFHTPSQPPRPAIVTGEIEARIIATACSEPPKGYARWSVRLLTDKLLELQILPEGSRETVRRTLKKLNLSLTLKNNGVSL